MKTMVKLAVVFATLLLVTGVSFAQYNFCQCYDITATEVDNPQHTETGAVDICVDTDTMSGEACSDIGVMNLALFYDKEFNSVNILATQDNSLGLCLGAFGFRFDYNYILGIGYCDSKRWTLKGHQADDCSCGG